MHMTIPLALHIEIPFPVVVLLWVAGVVLLCTLPKIPYVLMACPMCTRNGPFAFNRPCAAWWVILLLILLPPVGLMCILAMRRRVQVRCLACRMVICDGDVNAIAMSMKMRAIRMGKPAGKTSPQQSLGALRDALEAKKSEPFFVAEPEEERDSEAQSHEEDKENPHNPFA